jgi:hypothetical protein
MNIYSFCTNRRDKLFKKIVIIMFCTIEPHIMVVIAIFMNIGQHFGHCGDIMGVFFFK